MSHTRPALSLTNEYSDAVVSERLYYKFFAEQKASMFHPADDYFYQVLMEEQVMEQATPFAALIGIDWSDAKHDICLVETATGTQELSVVKHTPECLNEWARSLRARFGGAKVAVCLEQSRGSLIYALLKYDFLVLYPINPQTLSRFREAFTPSRAKDDPTDAGYLVELLIHHRERLKAWTPDDERTRTRHLLVEHRRRLVGDQTSISNRLTALLKGYFPHVLQCNRSVVLSL